MFILSQKRNETLNLVLNTIDSMDSREENGVGRKRVGLKVELNERTLENFSSSIITVTTRYSFPEKYRGVSNFSICRQLFIDEEGQVSAYSYDKNLDRISGFDAVMQNFEYSPI